MMFNDLKSPLGDLGVAESEFVFDLFPRLPFDPLYLLYT